MKSVIENVYFKKPVIDEISGRDVVRTFGNVAEEYEALRNGSVIYDCCNYGMYQLSGIDAEDLLETLCTKDIQYLNFGNISECYMLNENAELVGSVFVYRREEDFIVITPWEHSKCVNEWMEKNIGKGQDVTINNLTGSKSLISVEGPMSWKLVKNVFKIDIEALSLRYAMDANLNGMSLEILRIGRSSEYGYMLFSSVECGKNIYSTLLKTGEEMDFQVIEGGLDCLELAMLEVHQPNFIKETSDFGNILELSQQWYIQYDKETYIGHDKLMELVENGTEKGTVGFVSDESEAEGSFYPSGTKILADGEVVGEVIYSMYSFRLDSVLGIAILKNPYPQSGLYFEIQAKNKVKKICTISSPFVRPLSWDMKME